mmetsp:Transcript_94796/g.250512  ORF Transcript_94796/g.250512 Transcript_94796/m.250512 type:complete len:154 (+) Transcript_94796:178-639(+)
MEGMVEIPPGWGYRKPMRRAFVVGVGAKCARPGGPCSNLLTTYRACSSMFLEMGTGVDGIAALVGDASTGPPDQGKPLGLCNMKAVVAPLLGVSIAPMACEEGDASTGIGRPDAKERVGLATTTAFGDASSCAGTNLTEVTFIGDIKTRCGAA